MRSKLILLLVVLIFVILMLIAWILYDFLGANSAPQLMETEPSASETSEPAVEDSQAQPDPPEYPAPDFSVVDADGNEVHLSDFLGTPVVLNFWASWCGPCKSEMPDFDAAFQEYGDRIAFLMVNLTDGYQETVETASSFLEETDYTFPVYFDTALEGASAYGVSAVPVTYFIDAGGNIIAAGQGALTMENIQEGIGMILPNN